MNDKEALIKLIWLGIITGWEEFIEDMKKHLWIENEEEPQEKIDARFLRGKQEEIDNLRNEIKRLDIKPCNNDFKQVADEAKNNLNKRYYFDNTSSFW